MAPPPVLATFPGPILAPSNPMTDSSNLSAPSPHVSDLMDIGRDLLDRDESGVQSTVLETRDGGKSHLFAFPAGSGLPEHATDRHAVLHFIKGRARVTLGDTARVARAHTWISIPPNHPHAIDAEDDTLMLLHVHAAA